MHTVFDLVDDAEDRRRVFDFLEVLDGEVVEEAAVTRSALGVRELEVLSDTTEAAFGPWSDAERIGAVVDELVRRRWRPPVESVLRWFGAIAAERSEDPRTAVEHLERAVRLDPTFEAAVDRLAWSRSDQGDAAAAARLWRPLVGDDSVVDPDLAMVERFATPSRGAAGVVGAIGIGRNDRCWCGSGRKYKVCHLGVAASGAFPLPDRVPWLWRKAEAYVERRGGAIAEEAWDLAEAWAGDGASADRVQRAMRDPFVVDVLLTEGEWLVLFLADRGELLPEDEAELVTQWLSVRRSVFEVDRVGARGYLELTDLEDAAEVEVVDHRLAAAARPGTRWCARAVPDGEGGRRLVGSVFRVPGGFDDLVLSAIEEGDGLELVRVVASLRGAGLDEDEDEDEEVDLDSPPLRAALEQIRQSFERSWCDEPVPALGGLTPRAAVADPKHRGAVVRLLATFPDVGDELVVDGRLGSAMRPSRLRALLGLEADGDHA
jgi:hypothetical protein